jgi:hypothetical protein
MTRALTSVGGPLHSADGPARRSTTGLRRRVTNHCISNRNKVRIEIAVTYSKQTRGTNSNRNSFRGSRRHECGRKSHLCRAEVQPRHKKCCRAFPYRLRWFDRATPLLRGRRPHFPSGFASHGLAQSDVGERSRTTGHEPQLTNHNSPTGEEKANRNTCQFKNRPNSLTTKDITFSNRNKKHVKEFKHQAKKFTRKR